MPLQVSSASFCDICYDSYSVGHRKSPHVIPACGHVFCKACLLSLQPSLCPMCRQSFRVNEVLKLQLNIPSGAERHRALIQGVNASRSAHATRGETNELNLIHQALRAIDMQSDEIWEDVANTIEGAYRAGDEVSNVRQVIELWELAIRNANLYDLEKERSTALHRELKKEKRLRRHLSEDPILQEILRPLFLEYSRNPNWGAR